MKYNVLVLGSGGREHAIVWSIYNDDKINKIYCAPGNAGTSTIVKNIDLNIMNNQEILDFVNKNDVDVTIVGPEQPLENGLVDFFEKNNKMIFGPNKFSAKLETSKIFARNIMEKYNIPQPAFFECGTEEEILSVKSQLGYPIVLKADGLAAGKGVMICNNDKDLDNAIDDMIVNKKFGEASNKISVEEFLYGQEVSVFAICDGLNYKVINSAQDHKRAYDNDKGPNTGGMGAYCPAPIYDKPLREKVEERILKPILKAMLNEGSPYKGFLYLGLMISKKGNPYVIEFNVRLGDPEAQVLLPLFNSSVFDLILASINKKVNEVTIDMKKKYAVTIVLASKGYPDSYNKGMEVNGLDVLEKDIIFHAGTKLINGKVISVGGRVMNIVAVDESLQGAIDKAYMLVNKVNFENKYYRTDIGSKAYKHYNDEGIKL